MVDLDEFDTPEPDKMDRAIAEGGSVMGDVSMSSQTLSELVIYAARYCMTRQSYASSDGARLVETFASVIDDGTHAALLRDLSDWEAKGDACMHASFEVMPTWWKQALEALRKTKCVK